MDHTTGTAVASAGQRLAAVLRQHRALAGLTQQALARQVGYSRSTIANAEAGDVRAGEFYRRCDATLRAGGAVTAAYLALAPAQDAPGPGGASAAEPQSYLDLPRPESPGPLPLREPPHERQYGRSRPGHFRPGRAHRGRTQQGRSPRSPAGCAGVEALAHPLTSAPPLEAIEHLRLYWHLIVRTDNLLGPVASLPVALGQQSALSALLNDASGAARTALLSLSARYAETIAGICEDAGHQHDAVEWAGRALEWSHEVGDRRAVAWALYRRSHLYATQGDADRALSLARAALREGGELSRPMVAALHLQQARGQALAGDAVASAAALELAESLAAEAEPVGDGSAGQGGFCTRPWVAAQRGACALLLAAPAEAVAALRTALAGVAPVYHRDRGLFLGWLAEACARAGALEEAARAARQSLEIGLATGSARTVAQARAAAELVAGAPE